MMIKEFRDFLMRGNLIELAVAFVAGAAFTGLVSSLVNNIVMPIVAVPFGKPDFGYLTLTINDAVIGYGSFLTTLVSFVATMAGVFFLIVKPTNAFTAALTKPATNATPSQRECPECVSIIPAAARRCPSCTAQITPIVEGGPVSA